MQWPALLLSSHRFTFDAAVARIVFDVGKIGGIMSGPSTVHTRSLTRRSALGIVALALVMPSVCAFAQTSRRFGDARVTSALHLRADIHRDVRQERLHALIIVSDSFINGRFDQIEQLSLKNKIASVQEFREYSDVGGLMSYGPDVKDNFRRAAGFVDKIFKGTKPADIPVEQPTKFELVINLKTAKALGLTMAATLLATADEVIE